MSGSGRTRSSATTWDCTSCTPGTSTRGEVGEFEPVEYVEGLENPSEFPNLIRWLVGHGY